MDFTGPGVLYVESGRRSSLDPLGLTAKHLVSSSDAVFRYLLTRWGVHPKEISGASGPIRVGDVL
jgi:hypothetical protein